MVRRGPNRRDRRSQENGGPKNKRARRRTSDQEEETYSEDEECEEVMLGDKNKKANGEVHAPLTVKQEEETVQNKPTGTENGIEFPNGVKMEGDDEQNKKRYPMNGDVKKELVSDASGTKPYSDSFKPAELPMHKEQVSVSMTTTDSSGEVEQKPNIQSESSRPAEDVPPPQPVKRKHQCSELAKISTRPLCVSQCMINTKHILTFLSELFYCLCVW